MTDNRLKSFADRLDALEEEKKGISGDIKDVFVEVKSAGYNVKALRKVLADRRKKTDAELEADIELYRAALAEPGATYRSVAEKTGASKSKLQRLVPRERNGTRPPHDEDGVITETSEVDAEGGAAGHSSEPSLPAEQSVNPGPPPRRKAPRRVSGQGEQPGTHPDMGNPISADEAPVTPSGGAVAASSPRVASAILPSAGAWHAVTAVREAHHARIEAEREARRQKRQQENERASRLSLITDDDMPDQPPFLRRRVA